MTDLAPLPVPPATAWAALRAISAGAGAAADKVKVDHLQVVADETGANSFKTQFGKVYSSTTAAKVEILSSATLREWCKDNLDAHPLTREPSIIAEHYEDQFDDRQLQHAARIVDGGMEDATEKQVRDFTVRILRAAFPPRTVPERLAPWVIPYLIERAKIVRDEPPLEPSERDRWEEGHDATPYVIDSETGETWPWATVVPEKVTWNVRLTDESKAGAATALLEQLPQTVGLVGVETKAIAK